MTTIKEYLDYAELAQAAYSFLGIGTPNIQELNYNKRADFSITQAEKFSERYTVLAVSAPNANGFGATLFLDGNTGKKVLAVRGTDGFNDLDDDLYDGLSAGKILEQYASLVSFFEDLKSSGKISTADNLIVTGHSLGGALTQMITATYPSYVDEAYTYNSPGAKNLSIPPLVVENGKYYIRYVADELGTEISAELYNAYLSFDANKNSVGGKVVNVEAKDGPSVITDLGTDIGNSVLNIFINADMAYDYNHSSKTMTQALSFYCTLMFIDPTLTTTEITLFLEEVDSRNIIVKEKLDLHRELISRIADILGVAKADNVVDLGQKLVESGAKYAIDFLTDKTPSQLQSKDPANLYALLNLNPFAINGNLSAYDTINPADYSDIFLANRATYLYYTLDKHNRYDVVRGLQDYRDFTLGDEYDLSKGANVGKVLFGGDIDNTSSQMQGSSERDYLFGMAGNDTIIGNAGNDYLEGGKGFDRLQGGSDYDTYITDNGDTVMDSDGKGIVYFQEEHLSGGTIKAGASCDTTEFYYGDGGVYSYDKLSKQLTFTKNGTNETLSIENFTNTDLGITLSGAPTCPTTTGDCPKPINPIFNFNFSLPTPSQPVTYGTSSGGGGTYSGGGGGGGSSIPHTYTPAPRPVIECVNSPVYHSTGVGGGGSSTGPIVLDLNRDGITSISIAASQALFDYDSDGVKENTAWIQSTDALLVNDKNADGLINDASELFGNYTKNSDNSIAKSGYQALSYYDSNGDSIVDASDSRFEELSLWIDSNQDGVTDTGELKTLTEMGITSLTINSATPYTATTEENNTIIEETTFTDANGEGIMRDVLFRYENTSKPTDGVYFDMDANGIKEKMTTWTDPNQWMVVENNIWIESKNTRSVA